MIFEDDLMVDERVNIKPNRLKQFVSFFKNVLDIKIILYAIVLILVNMTGFMGVKPFGIVMLGVATIFGIPLAFPLVITLITLICTKAGLDIIINYALVYTLYIVCTSIIDIQGYSKKYTALIKLGISTAVSNLITFLIFRYWNQFLHCYIHKGDAKRGVNTNEIVKTIDFYKPVEKLKNGNYKMKAGINFKARG